MQTVSAYLAGMGANAVCAAIPDACKQAVQVVSSLVDGCCSLGFTKNTKATDVMRQQMMSFAQSFQ